MTETVEPTTALDPLALTPFARNLTIISVEEEMRRSYLDYAMSVIVGRALPDARDGLKPVHRRALFAMDELSNHYNKAYKKSARIVGDVIGKYHPHGDTAVYDAMVRLAQPFSMRYLLIDGQGNFGSVDGDSPAAMRYTEVRLTRLAHELMSDLDKDTVNFQANYDGSEHEPTVLPAKFPQLLVNGSSGIAVGMATNIPPHNLTEVINGCLAVMESPEMGLAELMQHIPAPDFPTAGLMLDAHGLRDAYATGRGRIVLRARSHIEDKGNRQAIIVTELPYQVNKARLLERIAELVKEKKLEGISDLRDESDKDGMRMYLELKRGENAEVVLNNLYQQTQLQTTFGINMVALDGGQPKTLSLRELLDIFIRHRRDVVTRRTRYLLRKARERAHILEGLAVALANLDDLIQLIREASSPQVARAQMLERAWQAGSLTSLLNAASDTRPESLAAELGLHNGHYRLSESQAQAILDMRLHRLTGLEQDKIHEEFQTVLAAIADYLDILGSEVRLMSVIRAELIDIRDRFGDGRKTEITTAALDLTDEDLIPPQDMVVTLSHVGYVKAQALSEYKAQKRGGRGRTAASTRQEDFVDKLWVAHSHDTLLCFSSRGRVYKLRVFELPQGSNNARGKPFVNLLPLETGEKINAVLPIKDFGKEDADGNVRGGYIFMATARGTVKKTPLAAFANLRSNGIIALDLRADDVLVGVSLTTGEDDVLLFSDAGRVIRFNESVVRSMGRGATGVRGMRLVQMGEVAEDGAEAVETESEEEADTAVAAKIIAMIVVSPSKSGEIMTVSEYGYGKRTAIEQFPLRGRGGKGVLAQALSDKTGLLIGALEIDDRHEVMLISDAGHLIRIKGTEVKSLGRNTQGVRLARPSEGDKLVAVDSLEGEEEAEEGAVEGGSELEIAALS
jgi:DNA gyrase subunit A